MNSHSFLMKVLFVLLAALGVATVIAIQRYSRSGEAFQGNQAEQASAIIKEAGVKGGLIVHLNCGNGLLIEALQVDNGYLVHGLDPKAENVRKACQYVMSKGKYGPIAVDRLTGNRLPYINNLVNLVVAEDLGNIPIAEVMRVLAPDGVAMIKGPRGWAKTVKYQWADQKPSIQVEAIVLADKTLFVAGPPNVVDEEKSFFNYSDASIQAKLKEQPALLDGKGGALLWAVDSANGETLAQYKLSALPVWDGMVVSGGKLYLATKDGEVISYFGKGE